MCGCVTPMLSVTVVAKLATFRPVAQISGRKNRYEAAKDNVSQGETKWDPADYLRLVSEEEQTEEESTTLDTIEKKLTSLAT